MTFKFKSGHHIYEEGATRHFLPVCTCEHLNDSIIMIIMSYTRPYIDCTIFVTDKWDISNVHKDFDLSDILVSCYHTLDRI